MAHRRALEMKVFCWLGSKQYTIALDFHPDIILLDIMMPGMDGSEVCRQLRERPGLQQTKIIMVSARGTLPDRAKGHEMGADDCIAKPFEEEELMESVEFFL